MEPRHYEERIGKLRVWLQRIASGEFGPLTVPSMARRAVEEDANFAQQYHIDSGDD